MSDVFEFAKGLEQEGEAYYRKLAEETTVGELKGVFNLMADEENRHFQILESIQKGVNPGQFDGGSAALSSVKDAFQEIAKGFSEKDVIENVESAYRKAYEMEMNGIKYYEDAMEKADNEAGKSALRFMIGQEKDHARTVEAIAEFVTRPQKYIEDAEWSSLEEIK